MKKTLIIILLGILSQLTYSQNFPALDSSPADIAIGKKDKITIAKVVYGRPQKKGRVIFGELEPYGKVWRTGANEATEIKFYKDVIINGKTIKAGTYSLFTIPEKEKWTIILNTELDQWGAYSYKKEKDIARIELKTIKPENPIEAFSMMFQDANNGIILAMGWDDVMVQLPITTQSKAK
ncbi:MAG: DUF2911 domain-containing protein [Cytophagales bacterium]|nr:MAG: DUF2911 domain-containing protein [Cytophagales bacterium]